MNKIRFSRLIAARAIRGMIVEAALGAVCGALYGATFGSFGIRIHGEISHTLPTVGFWAACVGSIAVLGGAASRLSEAVETPASPVATGGAPHTGWRKSAAQLAKTTTVTSL
jgi:hypothetical protein